MINPKYNRLYKYVFIYERYCQLVDPNAQYFYSVWKPLMLDFLQQVNNERNFMLNIRDNLLAIYDKSKIQQIPI